MTGAVTSRGQVALEHAMDLTEAQRLALAIQIAASITDPAEAPALLRLSTTARTTGDELSLRKELEDRS